MRVRAVGIVASSVLALVGASGPRRGPPTGARGLLPIIDEPRAGDVLHHQFLAQARAAPTRVEFVLEDEEQTRSITVSAPVVDGVAATVIPTWGFSGGVRVKARDCNGSVCGDLKSSPARLTVENDPMGIAQPVGPVDVTVGEQFVPVAISGPGGFLKLTLDGTVVLTDEGAITTPLDLAGRADGVYSLAVQRCSPVATACATRRSPCRRFACSAASSSARSDGPVAPFSPNGDGVRDSIAATGHLLAGLGAGARRGRHLDADQRRRRRGCHRGDRGPMRGSAASSIEIDPVEAGFRPRRRRATRSPSMPARSSTASSSWGRSRLRTTSSSTRPRRSPQARSCPPSRSTRLAGAVRAR